MFTFEELCPNCDSTVQYTIEDIDSSGFVTCKECDAKHLACSICTCNVDENGNCKGCKPDKTKWSLSVPDTRYALDELIKSMGKLTCKYIADIHSAEDKAEKSIESCMEQIQGYVHEYVRPYISLLCMEGEFTTINVITESPVPNLSLNIHTSGKTDLGGYSTPLHSHSLHEVIVRNWKSVKEDIHFWVHETVKHRLNDLKAREDKAKDTQYIADTFEV